MKRAIKWILIIGGSLVVIVIAALILIPVFVDVEQYKPVIEKQVAEATGRPFSIGGKLDLSLFPWAGFSFSDLRMGNPDGFSEKEFVTVKECEARVKLLPLLSKDIQARFVLREPRIFMERQKNGTANWEGLGGGGKPAAGKGKTAASGAGIEGLPIKSLNVEEFAITGGTLVYNDLTGPVKHTVADLTLQVNDFTLERPLPLNFSARVDDKPVALSGIVGPLGTKPLKGSLPFDLVLKALDQMELALKGTVDDPAGAAKFELDVDLKPFSPRKLLAALGQKLPMETSDPNVLNRLGLKAKVKGSPQKISLSNGAMELDDSNLTFSFTGKEFSKPDITFAVNLDKIDLDRYLPPKSEGNSGETKPAAGQTKPAKPDYTPLRKLVLDGEIGIGNLKVNRIQTQDLKVKIMAKEGMIDIDPISLNLYDGSIAATAKTDVRRDEPKSQFVLKGSAIQAGPLLTDLLQKDVLEGTAEVEAAIRTEGDQPNRIKETLSGQGFLTFKDGAIKGIDLAGMARNVKTAFGLEKPGAEKPRTDFSELLVPFTLRNGVCNTDRTSMMSPFLRLLASGKANLVTEALDFRVEPKFVGTMKGQGDTEDRGGIAVPVLVTGTFASPKFRPDLAGILKQQMSGEGMLKKLIPGADTSSKDSDSAPKSSPQDAVKGLLKSLPFGK